MVPSNTFRFCAALALEGESEDKYWMVHPGRNAAIRPRSSDGEETVSRESGQRTARSQSQLLQLCETWKGPDV